MSFPLQCLARYLHGHPVRCPWYTDIADFLHSGLIMVLRISPPIQNLFFHWRCDGGIPKDLFHGKNCLPDSNFLITKPSNNNYSCYDVRKSSTVIQHFEKVLHDARIVNSPTGLGFWRENLLTIVDQQNHTWFSGHQGRSWEGRNSLAWLGIKCHKTSSTSSFELQVSLSLPVDTFTKLVDILWTRWM